MFNDVPPRKWEYCFYNNNNNNNNNTNNNNNNINDKKYVYESFANGQVILVIDFGICLNSMALPGRWSLRSTFAVQVAAGTKTRTQVLTMLR